jgi:hypothetical protein
LEAAEEDAVEPCFAELGFTGSDFFVWPDIASGKSMTSAAKMSFFMAEIIAAAVNASR